jgi:Resolvase, N terminal domain
MNAIIGYARVSTQDQDLTAQLDALKAAGATAVYKEKISGARADRPELAKLMKAIKPDDVVSPSLPGCELTAAKSYVSPAVNKVKILHALTRPCAGRHLKLRQYVATS